MLQELAVIATRAKHKFTFDDALKFCSKEKSEEPKNSAPRAAVYEGVIGKRSKKAVKLQANQSKGFKDIDLPSLLPISLIQQAFSKISSLGVVTKSFLFFVLSIVLICVFCYQPAKICYTQFRNTEKAQIELSLVQERNSQLSQNVEALKTDEGIEDKAKSDYGYVSKGDGVARVSGIDVDNSSNLPEYVDANKVRASSDAVSNILDSIFGYDNSSK